MGQDANRRGPRGGEGVGLMVVGLNTEFGESASIVGLPGTEER